MLAFHVPGEPFPAFSEIALKAFAFYDEYGIVRSIGSTYVFKGKFAHDEPIVESPALLIRFKNLNAGNDLSTLPDVFEHYPVDFKLEDVASKSEKPYIMEIYTRGN